jgi:hypothetical protein
VSYLIWIGYEEVLIHSFSMSSSSEDIGFFVLDNEADKGEGSKDFFGVEVACMKGEKVEGICIRVDPWFSQVERSLNHSFFFWWS